MEHSSFVQESFGSMVQAAPLHPSARLGGVGSHSGAALLQRAEIEADRYARTHDPSLRGGFRVVYDREVPFELRAAEAPGAPTEGGAAFEGVMVKILVRGGASAGSEFDGHNSGMQPTELHVQLSSETDLFFHHSCAINAAGFEVLREEQRLTCGFGDFIGALQRLFNSCIAEPHTFVAVLLVAADGTSVLQLVQLLNYKVTELLLLPLRELPASLIREHVTFRYRAMRSRLDALSASLSDVAAFVKVREPAALAMLQQQHALSQRQLQLQSGSTIGTQTLPPPEPANPIAAAAPPSGGALPTGAPSPIPGLPPLPGAVPATSGGTAGVPVPVGAVGMVPSVATPGHTAPSPAPIGPSHPSYTY